MSNLLNINNICIFVILIILIVLLYSCFIDNFKAEYYTPSIVRYLPCEKNKNTCYKPFTNNKAYTTKSKDVYINQYGNRLILNPEQYLNMCRKLLNDLSKNTINKNILMNLKPDELKEKYYLGDPSYISNHFNNEINRLIREKDYLHHNGTWKYEYFNISNPTINYFEVNSDKIKIPNLNLFKIIYTLCNPLRSSYTSCFAFISEINNKLEIQFTGIVNDISNDFNDKLKAVPCGALNFTALDTIANVNFDQFGNPTDYSGLNFIEEPRNGTKINVKADIPYEFKKENFKPQYLPPLFGDGISTYPPIYKTPEGNKIMSVNPPIANGWSAVIPERYMK